MRRGGGVAPRRGGRAPFRLGVEIAVVLVTIVVVHHRAASAPDASHPYFCQVAQPMVARDDRRVEIHHVTYAFKLTSPIPGLEVRFTCHPGPVEVHPEFTHDTVAGTQIANLNAASLLGFTVRVQDRPAGTWSTEPDTSASARSGASSPRTRFYVNELSAELDVGTAKSKVAPDPQGLAQFDALVAATVDCLIENASHSHPSIRRLNLKVVGWDRYRHFSDSYMITAAPRPKLFRY